jgi:hypothetical protein
MVYQFASDKQRKWYFANVNCYSVSTGWIHITSLKDINEGLPPTDESAFDAWLIRNGIQTWNQYKEDLKNLPPWIRWLADIKTTILLSYILTFVSLLGAIVTMGEPAVVTATKIPYSMKMQLKELFYDPMFRSNKIRGNLVRLVKRVPLTQASRVDEIITKFEPYLGAEARSLANWAWKLT